MRTCKDDSVFAVVVNSEGTTITSEDNMIVNKSDLLDCTPTKCRVYIKCLLCSATVLGNNKFVVALQPNNTLKGSVPTSFCQHVKKEHSESSNSTT